MVENREFTGWVTPEVAHKNDKSGFYAAIIFFIWPLLGAVSAFKNYRSSWAKNIFWLFVAFYGLSFAIGVESENSDIVRYVAEVQYLYGKSMGLTDALNYYAQSGEVDILRTAIAILVSRFTDNQIALTFIYGTIFGFFYSRNIWFLFDHTKGKLRPLTILLLVSFFLVIPMWNITTFRMWTAAHIFLYGTLPYLYEGKKKGIVIAALAILVHYTFIIPVVLLLMYTLLGNRLTIYFVFFITTFFITQINLDFVNNVVESYAPESVQERTSGYRGEDYVQSFREGSDENNVWYAALYGRALRWAIVGFLVMLFFRCRKFFKEDKNKMWLRLFSFTLLFYGVANLLDSLPSGGRFIAIANVLALALIILYVQNEENEAMMWKLMLFSAPLLLLFIIVSVRMGLYSVSAAAVIGNPIVALFFNQEQLSLNDVLRMLI